MAQVNNSAKDTIKRISIYILLNAGLVNFIWWFVFIFGTHITVHQADFFNDVIAPNLSNAYTFLVAGSVILLITSVAMLKFGILLGKKISVLAIWLSIINPLFVALYYFLLFLYKKASIPNLVVIPFSVLITYFNLARAKPLIRKLING